MQLFARTFIGAAPVLRVTGHTVTGQTLHRRGRRPVAVAARDARPTRGSGRDRLRRPARRGRRTSGSTTSRSRRRRSRTALSAAGRRRRTDVTDGHLRLRRQPPGRRRLPLLARRRAAHALLVAGDAHGPGSRARTLPRRDRRRLRCGRRLPGRAHLDGPRAAPDDAGRPHGATPVVTGDAARRSTSAGPGAPYECSVDGGPFQRLRDVAVHDARPRRRAAHAGRARASTPTGGRIRRRSATPSTCPSSARRRARARGRPTSTGPDPRLAGDAAAGQRAAGRRRADAGDADLGHGLRQAAARAARCSQAGPLPGFVPLKGVAALPVGTIVDARRGTLALQSAGDGRPPPTRGADSAA